MPAAYPANPGIWGTGFRIKIPNLQANQAGVNIIHLAYQIGYMSMVEFNWNTGIGYCLLHPRSK